MDRDKKIELLQRSLGIRHKLKVHDSMKAPDTHEELALMLMARWELEDELRAIEEVLIEDREVAVEKKKSALKKQDFSFHKTPLRKQVVEERERS